MPTSGHNGNNETKIGMSSSISMALHDSDNNEIQIVSSKTPIDIVVPRDNSVFNQTFQYVNVTNLTISSTSYYMPSAFTISTNNASIHIELKPLSVFVGYVVILKLGYTPIVNATYSDFDFFNVYCPTSSGIYTLFVSLYKII